MTFGATELCVHDISTPPPHFHRLWESAPGGNEKSCSPPSLPHTGSQTFHCGKGGGGVKDLLVFLCTLRCGETRSTENPLSSCSLSADPCQVSESSPSPSPSSPLSAFPSLPRTVGRDTPEGGTHAMRNERTRYKERGEGPLSQLTQTEAAAAATSIADCRGGGGGGRAGSSPVPPSVPPSAPLNYAARRQSRYFQQSTIFSAEEEPSFLLFF